MVKTPHLTTRFLALLSFMIALMLMRAPFASASERTSYEARIASKAFGALTLYPDQAVTVWVDFENTGTATWKRSGKHFVALNVTDPAGRASAFKHSFWPRQYRPAKLQAAVVRPGETGRIAFALRAPKELGMYEESFQLVAENLTWIEGSRFSLPITVIPRPPAYQAMVVSQSATALTLGPNETAQVLVDVRNTGTASWSSDGKHFVALNVTDPAGRASVFKHTSWKDFSYRPTRLQSKTVKPHVVAHIAFTLQAPTEPGTYVETFQLVAENLTWIEGSRFSLTVVVPSPAPQTSPAEPSLDVGLRAVTEPQVVKGNGPVELVSGDVVLATVTDLSPVTLSYGDGAYRATTASAEYVSATPITVLPASADIVLEAVNFENRPGWNLELNDNRFRGSLRIDASTVTGRTWLVNRLPLESYLRGIAESGNDAPMEYLKALLIAARTYAYYHIATGTKHQDEHFTVDATNDQVYRGYNFELRAPRVTQAIDETRGLMVTYNGTTVITPYFSQSDGRTRSWEEVWSGGPYPWLVSVPDPAGIGKTLLGHGVGMSGHGALALANEGKTFQEILAYYYTGTAVTGIYQ